ncbi:hypothetical protein EET67_10520 [Pseudaminobacter arsenicus]|uniref:DUF4149 domain-containing protein n=1 Tax=Borborobacter arsenicus TaxID=1851146 RepID=A0A432V7A1_9HYPH|nr:hypothetical protein [Pseudaminobacter arsenicus]RUM98035.1 hypothetical protein EET67_10520 [Pseudaminobacter arsenicus]
MAIDSDSSARRQKRFGNAALAFVALFWLGLLCGVSFLATPVKFQAPSLDLPTALEVGRVTFALLARVEWLMVILLAGSLALGSLTRPRLILATGLLAIVALQSLWLLPVLDARIEAIVTGNPSSPTYHHMLYAVSEVAKAILLCVLGGLALAGLGARSRS